MKTDKSTQRSILFVAMPESIHTTRWIGQLQEQNWKVYLYPSYGRRRLHPDLQHVEFCIPFRRLFKWLGGMGLVNPLTALYSRAAAYFLRKDPGYDSRRLKKYIHTIRPQLIHSLETQGAGYLVLQTKETYFPEGGFPEWWHTNWGSDFYIYGRIPEHKARIQKMLAACSYYSCECERDVEIAKSLGFKGKVLPVYPNTGGFDAGFLAAMAQVSSPTSARKIIMLKGYQGWAGRALVGIRALEKCADLLTGYTLVVYANTGSEDIKIATALLQHAAGIPIILLPGNTTHQEIMTYHNQARISIGLSIGDAISTSLLEAMAMGSFPIQSCTACTSEWFTDGVTGIVVTPEDPESTERALRKALLDDSMVDNAAAINRKTIRDRVDFDKLRQITIHSYKTILNLN